MALNDRGDIPARLLDRILLSGDYPFHRLDAAAITAFLDALPKTVDRHRIAHANAESLYAGLSP